MTQPIDDPPSTTGIVLSQTLFGHVGVISCLAWASHGKLLASASFDKTVRVWEPFSGRSLKILYGHEFNVTGLAWSPRGDQLASASDDRQIIFWDLAKGTPAHTIRDVRAGLSSLDWSNDGRRLVSTCNSRDIHIWDATSFQLHKTINGHSTIAKSARFSPDNETLVTTSDGREVCLWFGDHYQAGPVLRGHKAAVTMAAWSPKGLLATASDDHSVRIWDAHKGQQIKVLEGHNHAVKAVSFSHDGNILASKSWDQTVRLWLTDTWKTVGMFAESTVSPFPALAFHPQEPILASVGGTDRMLRIWQIDPDLMLLAVGAPTLDSPLPLPVTLPTPVIQPPASPVVKPPGVATAPTEPTPTICSNCGGMITHAQAQRRRSFGFESIRCPICETTINLESGQICEEDPKPAKEDLLAWVGAERTILSVLFTDIVDSTLITTRLGNKAMRSIRQSHFQCVRRHISNHAGFEVKTIGDAFMVTFRTAVQALDCALDLQRDSGHPEIHVRQGIHVGPVEVDENDLYGSMVNFCARVESRAGKDQIWLSDEARGHIMQESAQRHTSLSWTAHENQSLKGFQGEYRLWSI